MVDKEKIKQAFNDFEEDNYTKSSDTLRGEVRSEINDFLKKKLELKNDPLDINKD